METLKSAADLQPFIIDDVRQPTVDAPQKLGSGSYGSVELLLVGEYQLKCAGKSLHSALVEAENEGVERITSRFVDECKLMSNLRHPNIVQFLGVCFLPSSNSLPVLLMEYMATNLDSYLEKNADIPLSGKVSILFDVAQGLAYLHSRKPPVIHRDLTATNILLNCSLSAKITDFGNSRIIGISPDQLAKTMTCVPGTLVYLPPEALNPKPKYNEKLDCFSYGQLALYTITQKFPMPSAPTFMDPETNIVMARTEVERREECLKLLTTGTKEHVTIKEMITNCLSNDPAKRPSSLHILSTVRELNILISCSDSRQNMLGMLREGALSQIEDEKAELEGLCQTQQRLLELREEEKQQQLEEIKNAKEHLATLERLCQAKENLLQEKDSESTRLSKLLELKEKKVTELQSSGKKDYMTLYENQRKELDDVWSKLNIRKMEIEGWERLCQAKDRLIEEKNAEKRQMMEQVRQRLEEVGTDPQLLQIEFDESGRLILDDLRKDTTSLATDQESKPETSKGQPPEDVNYCDKQDKDEQMASAKENIKIVIVGDGSVGKTCFIFTYTTNHFPMEYVPTVFDDYTSEVCIDGHQFTLGLWDTAGQEDYDRLRPKSYPETDCFLVCFSVSKRDSFGNVADKWVREIKHHCPSTPFLIVGLKVDLRDDESEIRKLKSLKQSPVTKDEGQAMAKKLGAYGYVECSAIQQKGVNNVFREVVKCYLVGAKSKKKKQCIVQ